MALPTDPIPLDHSFDGTIGVDVKGEIWPCIEMPDSKAFFGTGKSVKVVATIDSEQVTGAFMPTGTGGHMISVNAALRSRLDKGVGDTVTVRLLQRLS